MFREVIYLFPVCSYSSVICYFKSSKKLILKKMKFMMTYLAQSLLVKHSHLHVPPFLASVHTFTSLHVRRLHFVIIGFPFVLLSLSLRGSSSDSQRWKAYTKLMKLEWSEWSNESSYYPCSLRMNFHSVLFYKL